MSAQNENVLFVQSRNVRFHGWPGAHGNGADHLEPARTGPIESVARGHAEASFAGSSSGAAEGNRPPGAANAASNSRARGWCLGSRTTRPAIEPQAGGPDRTFLLCVDTNHSARSIQQSRPQKKPPQNWPTGHSALAVASALTLIGSVNCALTGFSPNPLYEESPNPWR